MTAPLLNRLLTLEAAEAAPDGAGGATQTWRAVGAHWAEFGPGVGAERVLGGIEGASVTHRATIRWSAFGAPSRPTPRQRFREGRRVFDVIAVTEADPRNVFLHVWLREGAPL